MPDINIVGPITTGMTNIAEQVGDVIGAVAPIAIGVVGVVIALRFGIGFVRSIVRA